MRALATTMALALLVSGAAVAAPGKGKPPPSGTNCKPKVSVILTGTLAADAGAAPVASLSVTVTGANKFGKLYKSANPVAVALTSSTKVNRNGDTKAADLKQGDRVNIRATACKADLSATTPPATTAVRVVAHPAGSSG